MIHLDSSFLIDLIRERARGQPGPATAWTQHEQRSELAVSLFVLCELEAGIANAKHPARERERVRAVIAAVTLVVPAPGLAARYGATLVAMQRAGASIGPIDLLIATTALEDGAAIVTANRRHFEAVPGLEVLSYR